jgi:glycosyltransferase involved in cell wall biosynthesis
VGAASRVAHLSDDELRSFYGGAEVFLLPSLLEGFGLPIVEALASGTPVVCARSIGAVEFVERGVVPVDTSSVEPIIEAVSEMARDDGLRERLVRDGGEQARSLTIPLMCERTMDVYREAAGSK